MVSQIHHPQDNNIFLYAAFFEDHIQSQTNRKIQPNAIKNSPTDGPESPSNKTVLPVQKNI